MTINWDIFYIFTIASVILWIISAATSATRNGISKIAVTTCLAGSIVFLVFIVGLWIYLQRPPLRTMVLTFHGHIRTNHIFKMEISLDTFILYSAIDCVLYNQHPETRNTRPVTDASPTKHLVYSARHCIYVLILRTWLCIYNRVYRAEKA